LRIYFKKGIMFEFDDKIRELVGKDELPFEANSSIPQQLNYYYQLKMSSTKVKQNSIIPLLGSLFTTKILGVKISIVAIAMFALIGYNQINHPSSSPIYADTIDVSKPIDSVGLFSVDDSLIHY